MSILTHVTHLHDPSDPAADIVHATTVQDKTLVHPILHMQLTQSFSLEPHPQQSQRNSSKRVPRVEVIRCLITNWQSTLYQYALDDEGRGEI